MNSKSGSNSKWTRTVLLVILILVLGAVLYWRIGSVEAWPLVGKKAKPVAQAFPKFMSSVMKVPPQDMPEAMAEDYRLKPDRRFMKALALIHSFLSSDPPEDCTANFSDNGWKINCGEDRVGVIPELPGYKDWDCLLSSWTVRELQKYRLREDEKLTDSDFDSINRILEKFLEDNSIDALKRMDSLWRGKAKDPRLLICAARGMVNLCLQANNELQLADNLQARAMCVLELAKAANNTEMNHEEALLAYVMGYTAEAARLAQKLPEEDSARMFVLHNDEMLEAAKENLTPEGKYIYLMRLDENQKVQLTGWSEQVGKFFPKSGYVCSLIKTGVDLQQFDSIGPTSPVLIKTVWGRVAQLSEEQLKKEKASRGFFKKMWDKIASSKKEEEKLPNNEIFDRNANNLASKTEGGFLDGASYKAYYESLYYDALWTLGIHYLDALSSIDAVRGYTASIKAGGTGTAHDFYIWYSHLSDSMGGEIDRNSLFNDIAEPSSLGTWIPQRSLEEIHDKSYFGDPFVHRAVRAIVARYDSRPAHLTMMARFADIILYDVILREKWTRSSVKEDPFGTYSNRVDLAAFLKDEDKLIKLLHDPGIGEYDRGTAFWGLTRIEGIKDSTLLENCEQVCRETPKSWPVVRWYAHYLSQEGKYTELENLLKSWISDHPDADSFDLIFAHSFLANVYSWQGKYNKALKAVEPVASSYQAGALIQYARALEGVGKKAEAEQVAKALLDRYPDGKYTRSGCACIFWRLGKYQEAADLYKNSPYTKQMSTLAWSIAGDFYLAFRDRPDSQAIAALSVLLKNNIDQQGLSVIPGYFDEVGRHELAFKLESSMDGRGTQNMYIFPVQAYEYLKEWKGEKEAQAWLAKTRVPRAQDAAAVCYLNQGENELLWNMLPGFESNGHAYWIWLMRTISWRRKGAPDNAHKAELVSHYKQNDSRMFDALGRYMLGIDSLDAVWPHVKTEDNRCEVAFYLGTFEESKGNLRKAYEWYRVAVETGKRPNTEYDWSMSRLHALASQDVPLSEINPNPVFKRIKGPLDTG